VNRAAEKIFGYSIEEMLGEEITMLMPNYLREVHKSAIARYTESGHRHIDWARIQLPGRHKDGREIPVELSIAEHSEAREKRFTGILRDVSERVTAEETLKCQTAIAANQANTVGEAITTTLWKVCEHSGAALGHAYFVHDGSPATRARVRCGTRIMRRNSSLPLSGFRSRIGCSPSSGSPLGRFFASCTHLC
jgi:PAS domain S-box-containing protein